ncbi:piggyBac transposable element-derived protein 4-like [Neodiprion pinetum]|uniref:piggyBac transposable element-derived protein 4-like n=1 Tax=Neodiprion pinetum TaxID=441929 RepID=UPI001EE04A86|nr:uncharacterized protein LOC124215155 isoform X1 [Neodiprion pinetum]XP_046474151.1 uncharacterized protein LOC124215155 isoform X1 [Neodiprion pinetum]
MSHRYKLRSVAEVKKICEREETEEGNDRLSSDEESDYIEEVTNSESEETVSDLETTDESESESASQQYWVQTGRKRQRPTTQTSCDGRIPSVIYGHDGYQWYSTACQKIRHQNHSTSFLPGPVGEAWNAKTPLEAWSLLLNDTILEKIVRHTNEEIIRYRNSVETEKNVNHVYSNVEMHELKAFIGILYFMGLQKTSSANVDDLWSAGYGSVIYRATMSIHRYHFLSRMIRFDDKNTRPQRREMDKFAPIRLVWEIFTSNCTKFYIPASYCTIDEQLVSFSGRCPFKVYNGLKPDEYGIKIIMVNDSHTFYMYSAEPYLGKVTTDPGESVSSYYLRKLSEPLHGTLRNLTCGKWFSSVEIFDKMLQDHSLMMVGTIKRNRRQIPDSFRKAGPVSSTKFAFDGTKTLVCYTLQKKKIVLVLSTFHQTVEIDKESQKPEIIKFYNSTKGGTDTFNQMCLEYTTARKTSRWPIRIWMAMLDQAAINAMVLYNFNGNNQLLARRQFLKTLGRALIEPHLRAKLRTVNLRRNLRLYIEEILDIEKPIVRTKCTPTPGKRARCAFCPRSNDRKSRTVCAICNRILCEEHRTLYCPLCSERD